MLTHECLEDLVKLVNEELDSEPGLLRDKLNVMDAELIDVEARLSKLNDTLETGKLNLDDLSPRIKELKARQDQLAKARVQVEANMVVESVQHIEADVVKSYAQDLRSLLEEGGSTQSKTFLRSFVKKVIISEDKAKIQYHLPMLPDGKRTQSVGVLPIDTLGGPLGTVTELLFEKKGLIPSIQQLLVS